MDILYCLHETLKSLFMIVEAQQIKFLRPFTVYTLMDQMCTQLIRDQLGATNIAEDIERYQLQWRTCGNKVNQSTNYCIEVFLNDIPRA
jgi:hypothetical protein